MSNKTLIFSLPSHILNSYIISPFILSPLSSTMTRSLFFVTVATAAFALATAAPSQGADKLGSWKIVSQNSGVVGSKYLNAQLKVNLNIVSNKLFPSLASSPRCPPPQRQTPLHRTYSRPTRRPRRQTNSCQNGRIRILRPKQEHEGLPYR